MKFERITMIIGLLLLAAIAGLAAFAILSDKKDTGQDMENINRFLVDLLKEQELDELKALNEKAGQHMRLPETETPAPETVPVEEPAKTKTKTDEKVKA